MMLNVLHAHLTAVDASYRLTIENWAVFDVKIGEFQVAGVSGVNNYRRLYRCHGGKDIYDVFAQPRQFVDRPLENRC